MAHEWAKGLTVILLLIGLVATIMPIKAWKVDTPRQETLDGLATGLFDKWLFAFEFLSILLLAALIGALFISERRRGEEGSR